MQASALTRRAVFAAKQFRPMVRSMGGGHGHGKVHKTLPPRPALAENATFAQKFEHTMWYKRNPDYEGIEAYVRYYLPENHHLVYFVLGLYGTIITYFIMKGKAAKKRELRDAPRPDKPDYHTPIVASSDIPDFGSEAWEAFVNGSEGNFDKWIGSLPA